MDADADRIARQLTGTTRTLCPRCGKRHLPATTDQDFCTVCVEELDELERSSKRRYQRNLQANPTVWLQQKLRHGPVPSRKIKHQAQAVGITKHDLFEAFQALDVAYDRRGNGPDHHTVWMLPRHADSSPQADQSDE